MSQMPHLRPRHALSLFQNLAQYSPLVGVFGHRQVGKTTFVSHSGADYVTLDDEDQLAQAMAGAKAFVARHGSRQTVIDECQMAPPLFPALKEWVRKHPQPGQFILIGSVRFSSRKAIRESLTGRIVSLELYPLVLSELLERELPDVVPGLIEARQFDENTVHQLVSPKRQEFTAWSKYLEQGGLPRLTFTRDERNRSDLLDSLLRTILDRDLRMVLETRLSLETLLKFLRFIATRAWQVFQYAEARRETGLTEVTQKRLLVALESIFLVRRVPLEGRSGAIFLLNDQLEERFLSRGRLEAELQVLGALYRNIRAQFGYRPGASFELQSFQLRSGARVPLVIRTDVGELGIIAIAGSEPTLSQKRSADRFLRDHPRGKIVFASTGTPPAKVWDARVLSCSAVSLVL
jgi:hypothetical protein